VVNEPIGFGSSIVAFYVVVIMEERLFIRIESCFFIYFEYKILLYLPKDWGLAHLLCLLRQKSGSELIFSRKQKTQARLSFFVLNLFRTSSNSIQLQFLLIIKTACSPRIMKQ
jgi:hypothetical protein